MRRIYMAARYSRRGELMGYRAEAMAHGHEVVSRWMWGDHELPIGAPKSYGVRFAQEDAEDLMSADTVISFTEKPGEAGGRNRGGRHVEFGLALGLNAGRRDHHRPFAPEPMRLIVVGWRENVFHYLPEVEFHRTWASALAALRS